MLIVKFWNKRTTTTTITMTTQYCFFLACEFNKTSDLYIDVIFIYILCIILGSHCIFVCVFVCAWNVVTWKIIFFVYKNIITPSKWTNICSEWTLALRLVPFIFFLWGIFKFFFFVCILCWRISRIRAQLSSVTLWSKLDAFNIWSENQIFILCIIR